MEDNRPTHRQLEIMTMCAVGMSREEIGRELFLSPHTVKRYLDDLRELLDARNVTHALAICLSQRWLFIDAVDGTVVQAEIVVIAERELVAA